MCTYSEYCVCERMGTCLWDGVSNCMCVRESVCEKEWIYDCVSWETSSYPEQGAIFW